MATKTRVRQQVSVTHLDDRGTSVNSPRHVSVVLPKRSRNRIRCSLSTSGSASSNSTPPTSARGNRIINDLPATLQEAVQHLKTDRTEQDILFELLLKLGLDLTVPIADKPIASKTVYSIGAGALLTCLADQIGGCDVEPLALGIAAWHKDLAPAGEAMVVFRDIAFSDDVAKTNLTAILQQHGLENVRSL